ncbi:MAG TPA: sensor histidine kinase, partial [Burkholderiales bacterium]|nr:sensor histidine kinase [Burkholderiales bacterium]
AREIHDDLGGTLTAMKIDLMSLANHLPKRSKALLAKVESVDRLVDSAIDWSARIAADLRPAALDCGIVAAIQWQTREFEERTGIHCEVKAGQDDIALDSGTSIAMFRIYQEALTNIAKHAQASCVKVELAEGHNAVVLRVTDDGCGITESSRSKPSSFGIRGMLERARKFGGQVTIDGVPGMGTVVTIRAPRTPQELVKEEVEHQYRLL